MNKIVYKEQLSNDIYKIIIQAPLIAEARKPGQFVILQDGGDFGERIPLTIADADIEKGTITLIIQASGESTMLLTSKEVGDSYDNVLGPLGNPTELDNYGKVLCVGGGVGVAPMYPIAKALHNMGNEVKIIMGARNKDLFVMKDEMSAIADELILITDDGSSGRKGLVTEPLKELCEEWKPDVVFIIGPPIMMKFCALTTKPFGIKSYASLNTIMIDGTGMCGGCRVSIGDDTKFVCVDGPEFDAHKVDWNNMLTRLGTYKGIETEKKQECLCELKQKNEAR